VDDRFDSLRQRYALLTPQLDERKRSLFAATEATGAGDGGIAAVGRITGQRVIRLGPTSSVAAGSPPDTGSCPRFCPFYTRGLPPCTKIEADP
jgi:hypothetical protein